MLWALSALIRGTGQLVRPEELSVDYRSLHSKNGVLGVAWYHGTEEPFDLLWVNIWAPRFWHFDLS